ncbi:MAG: hypothetical protein A3D67_00520 [Candidatus Lloydbacteria bacterium RIFCSPHIGHO2_02_FULL_51_22]|uniref:Uncharacterized protein n=1 Tax=Candidatus Lloydbacteria bacterium RIFCSPHIGHO2_02_FULL_51_22 TaxID=1798663 RepID=A0A1G2DFD1_9BACT|nr:MAG: hypothetical protein A3D67_00520 [Candidatus Lloydbacteria bacterium RIFCSPHIGHO2_02_FULL_51_22]
MVVVAGVLELTEPIQHCHIVGEVEVGQLLHQSVVQPLHLSPALLVLTRRLLAFGRIAICFGAALALDVVVGDDAFDR